MSATNESEQVFKEYYELLEQANKVKNNPDLPQRAMLIEFMKLTEGFEKLLKTSVRIARMGDRAQNKLLKYKELMDTLRNLDE